MGQYGPNFVVPNTPTYYNNPLMQSIMDKQNSLFSGLSSGNFTGDLSWLNSAINPDSGYLQSALSAAQGALQPQFRDTLQQITNTAAANNNLSSSTFTDALARAGSDLNSQYQSMVGNAALQNYTNSMNNRLGLFQAGLGLGQQAYGNAAGQSSSQNAFNLANYSNVVDKALQDNQNLQNYPTLEDMIAKFSGKDPVTGRYNKPIADARSFNYQNQSDPFSPAGAYGYDMWGNPDTSITNNLSSLYNKMLSGTSSNSASASQYYPSEWGGNVNTGYTPSTNSGWSFSAPSRGLTFSKPSTPFGVSNTKPFDTSRILDYLK